MRRHGIQRDVGATSLGPGVGMSFEGQKHWSSLGSTFLKAPKVYMPVPSFSPYEPLGTLQSSLGCFLLSTSGAAFVMLGPMR